MKMQTYNSTMDFRKLENNHYSIVDIAHSLSRVCRFNGHISISFYSVAEHCFWCSEIAPKGLELACLLHDAEEAYTGDLIRPYAEYLYETTPDYAFLDMKENIRNEIYEQHGVGDLTLDDVAKIQEIDDKILATEYGQVVYKRPGFDWHLDEKPWPGLKIVGFDMETVKRLFLNKYNILRETYHV